ncbi:MAG: glutamine-hydrolyzing GMP synthase [Patescibacteria group bacterium]|jgi:GMP synthase (glutamine-hydrolysing)
MEKKYIAILDFGSQYTHLIARRIRQLGVLAKIYSPDVEESVLKESWGIILSGSPKSVYQEKIPYNPVIFKLKKPLLGLCYGHQLMAYYLGGKVGKGDTKEYGEAKIKISKSKIFQGLKKEEVVWMSHGDYVSKLPAGFKLVGKSRDCAVSAMADEKNKRYGFQFHPEVFHTKNGQKIISNFVFSICEAQKNWNAADLKDQIIKDIKEQAKDKKVFLLVSGGVDSTVAYALLEKALGKERVYGFHVDTGFMRLNESAKVKKGLAEAGFKDLKVYDASGRFMRDLEGVAEPEEKRKIIGELFVTIANEEMRKLNIDEYLLGQGTIYPDTIESGGTAHADKIKTHHNRVDLIQEMIKKGRIIEPLKDLYKDEVRALGRSLGLAEKLLERHPFPGPGLAIRALCSMGREKVHRQHEIEARINKLVAKYRLRAHVLPIKSVGVQGDERSYKHPVVLMGKANFKILNELSVLITNKVHQVNRVLYLVSAKNKKLIFRTKIAFLIKERMNLLKQADDIVMNHIAKNKIDKEIWQFPSVLVPMGDRGESLVLRPIESQEAMTVNFYQMKKTVLQSLLKKIKKLKGIDYIFYDITNKPPGTIEWE